MTLVCRCHFFQDNVLFAALSALTDKEDFP